MKLPPGNLLLDRDTFREAVFFRDNNKCVVCQSPAQDAHHIFERKLFDTGGYYLNNGASLCGPCHIKAEMTLISVEDLWEKIGVGKDKILPPQLYEDEGRYDKWANDITNPNRRIRGELFDDEQVQKILGQAGLLHLFSPYVKYPRTYHLPWSPGFSKDDRVLPDTKQFEGHEVLVTVKLDGENTNVYPNYIHARSTESKSHPTRDWVKAYSARWQHELPEGWRVCGENLRYKKSIKYKLSGVPFRVFSIWDGKNNCLSWEDTVAYAELLGLTTVPVLYRGPWDEKLVRNLHQPEYEENVCEGYVVRLAGAFHFGRFRKSMAKYVRKDHVQTHGGWMHEVPELNEFTEL